MSLVSRGITVHTFLTTRFYQLWRFNRCKMWMRYGVARFLGVDQHVRLWYSANCYWVHPAGYRPELDPYSTPAVEGDGWPTLSPGRFTCGKETSCALYRRLGGLRCWSGWARKISPYTGVRNPYHPPLRSRYLNYMCFPQNKRSSFIPAENRRQSLIFCIPK